MWRRQIRAEVFANLLRLAQPQFSRGELLAEYFDPRELFERPQRTAILARRHTMLAPYVGGSKG